jgi:hypothetical protein
MVLSTACVCAQVAVSGANREISGVVVSAKTGEPLPAAQLTLVRTRDRKTIAETSSDNEGNFVFRNLDDGKFDVVASRQGYTRASYQQHVGVSTAIVTGEGMISTGLRFELEPQARIYGRVEEDSGDPVPRARVSLFRKDLSSGTGGIVHARSTGTDAMGNFEINNLQEGEYFLCASGSPWYASPTKFTQSARQNVATDQSRALLDVAYATTCYPGVNPKEAEPIRIVPGDRLPLNITMHPEPALHLVIPVPAPQGQHGFPSPQLMTETFGVEEPAGTSILTPGNQSDQTSRSATAEITGITPGQYELLLRGSEGEGTRRLSINAESSSMNLDTSAATPMPEFIGQVIMADGGAFPVGSFISLNSIQDNRRQITPIRPDGSFKLESLRPGHYEVGVIAAGSVMAIDHLAAKGAQVSGHTLTVGSESVIMSTIVSKANATVNGFATKRAVPAAGIFMLLVPGNAQAARQRLQRNQSDSDGSFNFPHVPPGTYTVVAIEEGWKLNWALPEVLAPYISRGQKVTVNPQTQEINLSNPVEAQPLQ